MLMTTTTFFSQRAEPLPLWLETFTKRRIRGGRASILGVRCEEAMGGCASRVPLPPGAAARRTRGVLVEGAPPLFDRWCGTGERQRVTDKTTPLPSP